MVSGTSDLELSSILPWLQDWARPKYAVMQTSFPMAGMTWLDAARTVSTSRIPQVSPMTSKTSPPGFFVSFSKTESLVHFSLSTLRTSGTSWVRHITSKTSPPCFFVSFSKSHWYMASATVGRLKLHANTILSLPWIRLWLQIWVSSCRRTLSNALTSLLYHRTRVRNLQLKTQE